MLQADLTITCYGCGEPAEGFERGWRAYFSVADDMTGCLTMACPNCTERFMGEDEAAWSD